MKRFPLIINSVLFLASGVLAFALVHNYTRGSSSSTQFTDKDIADLIAQGRDAEARPLLLQRYNELKDKDQREAGKVYQSLAECDSRLKIARAKLVKAATGPATSVAVVIDTGSQTTAPARVPHPIPAAGEIPEMTVKEFANFPYDADKNTPVPNDIYALEGHTFRLHGYMLPLTQAEMITEFALVPSLFNCCFGQPPGVEHTIIVHLPKNKGVDYTTDEIAVEGTIHIKVERQDDYTIQIFTFDASSVKNVAR